MSLVTTRDCTFADSAIRQLPATNLQCTDRKPSGAAALAVALVGEPTAPDAAAIHAFAAVLATIAMRAAAHPAPATIEESAS